MGMNEFAPFRKINTSFIVKNISNPRKTVKIFTYPILWGQERDLLAIKGVAEADLRASLLKGELKNKLDIGEISIIESDIDLLQFNNAHKATLTGYGITTGLEVSGTGGSGSSLNYVIKQNIALTGTKNESNRLFLTPDTFINNTYFDNEFAIIVKHNGRVLYQDIDYTLYESGGLGTGYNGIYMLTIMPSSNDTLFADYMVEV